MTAPPQKWCQAPECEKPIPAERLRRHPDTKTCSDDCRNAYRNAKQTRPERKKRKADRIQKGTKRRIARAAEAARASGWQDIPCDYDLLLGCSGGLKRLFDESIPEGQRSSAWLREILITLMRPKGLRTWALNEQVAVAPDWDREDDVAHGTYPLRCCIPSCLKNDMRQRAKRENAPNMANWLRTSIYRAVKRPESWNPQTPVQQLNLEHAALRTASRADPRFYYVATTLESKYDKQGLAQAWGVESYELFIHPLSLSSYLGRQPAIPEHLLEQKCEDTAYLRAVIDRCRALETRAMQPIDNLFEEAPRMRGGCADDPFYYEINYPTPKQPTLPKGAPRPGSPQEWDAASELSRLPRIWELWSAAAPEGVRTLHQLRQLYQQMHRAEQAYARVLDRLRREEEADDKAHERAERDCLLWEGKEELDRRPSKAAERNSA